jgi:hypothetical protein
MQDQSGDPPAEWRDERADCPLLTGKVQGRPRSHQALVDACLDCELAECVEVTNEVRKHGNR